MKRMSSQWLSVAKYVDVFLFSGAPGLTGRTRARARAKTGRARREALDDYRRKAMARRLTR